MVGGSSALSFGIASPMRRMVGSLFAQCLEQRISRIRVVHDRNLRGQLVGQVKELLANRNRHENFLGTLVSSQFDDAHCVVNRLNGPTEIEASDDNKPPFEAPLNESRTHREQNRYSRRRCALACIERSELDRELVSPWITVAHELFRSGIKILFSTA